MSTAAAEVLEPAESLNTQFAALHAHRVATMPPAELAVNVNQRRRLVETLDRTRLPKLGDTLEPFSLTEVGGTALGLLELVSASPAVLIFFRFAGCPACNLALPYYQRQLHPTLRRLGVKLVAVSPQVPERLVEIQQRHGLEFPVASDPGNRLGRRLGILYSFDKPSRQAALARGKPIGEITGTGTWELPMPAVLAVDQARVIRFIDVSPDWLVRTEAEPILAAVRAFWPPLRVPL